MPTHLTSTAPSLTELSPTCERLHCPSFVCPAVSPSSTTRTVRCPRPPSERHVTALALGTDASIHHLRRCRNKVACSITLLAARLCTARYVYQNAVPVRPPKSRCRRHLHMPLRPPTARLESDSSAPPPALATRHGGGGCIGPRPPTLFRLGGLPGSLMRKALALPARF